MRAAWSLREGEDADRLRKKIANACDYAGHRHSPARSASRPKPLMRSGRLRSARPRSQDDGSKFAHLEVIHADTIKMTIIDWLWPGHLALGRRTCIAGVEATANRS